MRKALGFIATGVLVANLGACGGKPEAEAPDSGARAVTEPPPADLAPAPPSVASLSDNDLGRVCRAAVAALNGRDPAIIKVERVGGGIAHVGYVRPNDGKAWKNQCRVEGDRVVWASVDLNGPGSGPGRWRTDTEDEVVTYAIEGKKVKVTIRYSDGSTEPEHVYEIG
jgi:hypothetical protein